MTAVDTIDRWFEEGKTAGSQYMLVVTDTFDYSDFPVYAEGPAQVIAQYRQYAAGAGSMHKVMEVYDLTKDKWAQLASAVAWELPSEDGVTG